MNQLMDTTGGSTPDILSLAQIQHLMRVEFSRAQRYGYPIVCLVVAIDQLGTLRDRLGYEVKEAVVDRMIELLHTQTRGSDFIGRLPDDRFMIVVPHSEAENVKVMARRLVAGTRALELPELDGGRLTLSVGGSWMSQGETLFFDDLLQTAKNCLASVASSGGDDLLFAGPEGIA